jgi:putative hemolysin
MDGALDLGTVMKTLDVDELLNEDDRRRAHTLGGLAMLVLGRIPRSGDVFERGDVRFEIVDMDGHRVDRLVVSRPASR